MAPMVEEISFVQTLESCLVSKKTFVHNILKHYEAPYEERGSEEARPCSD
jgi:hypothetical protein